MELLIRRTRSLVLPALLAALAASPVRSAPQGEDVLTPHRLAALREVGSAAISPDGTRVAYTLRVPAIPIEEDDGAGTSELHLLDLETGRSRPFVTEGGASSVRWTPDGTGISFLAKRGDDEHTALYVIPVDGGEARRAAGTETSVLAYDWNGDGTRVALVAREPDPEEVEKARKQGFGQEIYEEDYRHRRLYVAEPFADEDAETLEPLGIEGSIFSVAWCPIDDRLAIAVAPTPLVDDSYVSKKVHVVDANSGETLVAFDKEGKLEDVVWSPDGEHLAILAGVDLHDPAANRLLVAPSHGGPFTELMPGRERDVTGARWTEGEEILFVGAEGVRTVLGVVSVERGQDRLLLEDGPALGDLTLSADGQHAAFVGSTAEHPSEVFTMSHGETTAVRRTTSNPWLADLRLAPQEVVRYTARDGVEVEGLLIRPLGEVEGTRYPLMLVVHGGPESHYSNGWLTRYSTGGQIAAARGFAVFFPNYRGSTGRGHAFALLSQGDPAGAEFDDLVDGVEHLVSTGLVDRSRVGVTGGSYGGYATAWCSTALSEHFAAGVMFVGISNKISKWGTTDIPEEEFNVHARKRVWDDWNYWLERSPIFHADKGNTPLLILHGKEDPRVDPGQSREIYRHLKARGNAPVRLVYYPGEGHGNRKAAARLDYSLRLMRWMEHYLQGDGGAPPPYEIDHADPTKTAQAEDGEELPLIEASNTGR